MKLLFIILFFNLVLTQCSYDIGDINQDENLDIVDIIGMVDFVLSNDNNTYNTIYDLNSNNLIDIVDIITLINRILSDEPLPSNFLIIDYNFQNLELIWESSTDQGFENYNVYYSDIISEEDALIYTTSDILDTAIVIGNLNLKEQNCLKSER